MVICAWCLRVLSTQATEGDSHGICEQCSYVVWLQFQKDKQKRQERKLEKEKQGH